VFVDDFLPSYDVSDEISTAVAADVPTTWAALIETDMVEVARRRPLVAVLGGVRVLPDIVWQLLHGEQPADVPKRLTLHDIAALPMSNGRWVQLGERPQEEIAFGLIGKFWRPVIQFAAVEASEFREFDEPGYAKTVYSLGTRGLENGKTLLWAAMRTSTTDERARTWFRRYWTFGVAYGAHVLVHALLDVVHEQAEQRGDAAPGAPGV
jgi:hypothetical protein